MKTKRAILVALALYLTTFIIGIVLTIIAKVSLASPQEIPTTYWVITIVVTVLLTTLASIWYFNKPGISRNIKEGFKLGITFIIVGLIIDLIFFIPLFITSGASLLIEYYSTPSFYITLILVVMSSVFIGSRSQSKIEVKTIKKIKK